MLAIIVCMLILMAITLGLNIIITVYNGASSNVPSSYTTLSKSNESEYSYGIVMDAGSVHTNLNLFRWPNEKLHGTGLVREDYACEIDATRGISSFADTPEKVREYLTSGSSCLSSAVNKVPERQRECTPVFMGGTGGMRVLNATSPDKVKSIFFHADKELSRLGLKTRASEEILDSDREGVLGWVTANYLSDRFSHQSNSTMTLGALDWGGASSQITFELDSDDYSTTGNDTQLVSLFGQDYRVFTSSQLCYGQAEALKRYLVRLVYLAYENHDRSIVTTIDAPCQPRNHKYQTTARELFDSLCTEYKDSEFKVKATADPELTFTFLGRSDHRLCHQLVEEAFNYTRCEATYAHGHCFKRPLPSPPAGMNFLAFSTYWYLTSLLNLADDYYSATTLSESVRKLCASSVQEAHQMLSSAQTETKVTSEIAGNSCFRGLFMLRLLSGGYQVTEEFDVEFVGRLGDAEVGWTLGYMLRETNSLPACSGTPEGDPVMTTDISRSELAVLVVVVLFLLVLGGMFIRLALAKRQERAEYAKFVSTIKSKA